MPELWRRHPADCLQTAFRVRNHPWPSHSWQPPVAADFLSASRGRSGKSSRILANRSSRHRCRPLVARPPTGASSCRSTTVATSFKPRPTICPQLTSTASESCQTRGINEAARWPDSKRLRTDPRKTPLRRGRACGKATLCGRRETGARGSRAAHPLGNGCRSAIGRAILGRRDLRVS